MANNFKIVLIFNDALILQFLTIELNWLNFVKGLFSQRLVAHFLAKCPEFRSNEIRRRIISWNWFFLTADPISISDVTFSFLSADSCPSLLLTFPTLFLSFLPSKHHAKFSRRHANWLIRFNWSIHRPRCVEHANELGSRSKQCRRNTSHGWRNRLTNVFAWKFPATGTRSPHFYPFLS